VYEWEALKAIPGPQFRGADKIDERDAIRSREVHAPQMDDQGSIQ
jgi:hypothetical protein